MKKALFSLFLFAISSCLWSQSDPYFKLISIPADIEKQAQIFLQSTCDSIQFIWKEELPGGCKDGIFLFILPLQYTQKHVETIREKRIENYTEKVLKIVGKDADRKYVDVQKERPVTEYYDITSIVPTSKMMSIKNKLTSQKKYNSSIQIIKKFQGFDKTYFQDSVKNEINTKYSNQEYKKYIENKDKELEELIKEWETVPLTDAEIKAQKNRIRSSWRNFDQERAIKLKQFNSECIDLFEAKRFVYKYEHDIP